MTSLRLPIILAIFFFFIAVYVESKRKMKRRKRRRTIEVVVNKDGQLDKVPNAKWLTKPESLNFVWETPSIGHVIDTGVTSPIPGKTVTLTVASQKPRIFVMKNFISDDEIKELKRVAVDPRNPYSMRPSTVGPNSWTQKGGERTESTRTSSNAWDVSSPNAMRIKRRAFEVLRLRYNESMADAIQVLRYQLGQAYITHTDQYSVGTVTSEGAHNFDPQTGGANRLATLFLYLSDVAMGGQTVFPASNSTPLREPDQVAAKRASEVFSPGSWEAEAVDTCYSKFAVYPKKGEAILFYTQHEDGALDADAEHAGCPVLEGEKWAANLWVWNGCRYGLSCDTAPYDGLPA